MILASINWNVNPEIFRIGGLAIRYYGVLWALSFYLGYLIFDRFVKREGLPEGFLDSLTIYTAVGTIAGARLGHCLFYEPAYYLSHPIDILKIWQGGLASHGAAVGIITALILFSRKWKVSTIYVLDRVVITVALAGILIRLGNLMNSEIYGVETNLPWGFIFERNGEIFPKHPTQIYEAFMYLLIFIMLYLVYIKSKGKPREGVIFGLFLSTLFTARFFIEFLKEPQVEFEKTMTINMGQWLSIPFVLAGIGFIGYAYYQKSKENY
ncbi:MAG: prolipoprotein diacylglyceryl transferase [Bacteroidales bacterium]|nr:MAG: prolipoprotein diacylglyceryl transferase [Bacteroidales bacterium]